jgi:hypothetical protein
MSVAKSVSKTAKVHRAPNITRGHFQVRCEHGKHGRKHIMVWDGDDGHVWGRHDQ